MQANLTLPNARVYNVVTAMIVTNQQFDLKLVKEEGEDFGQLSWFADNDPVLEMEVAEDGMSASFTSKKEGKSTILVMNPIKKIAKQLDITVVSVIPIEADTLNATAGEPVQK
jgi:hypothetical protein